MRENIKYMLKNWIAWDKKSLLYFLFVCRHWCSSPLLPPIYPRR